MSDDYARGFQTGAFVVSMFVVVLLQIYGLLW